jgi:hypothetical protein
VEPFSPTIDQASPIQLNTTSEIENEMQTRIWAHAAGLAAPELTTRIASLEALVRLDCLRREPLLAYLLATRLGERDVRLRGRVVVILGNLVSDGTLDELVKGQIAGWVGQMRTREIFGLLQAYLATPTIEIQVINLLRLAPHAGRHLGDIVVERKFPVEIRKAAALFTGKIGYLQAIPALERTRQRLEARQAGIAGLDMGAEKELLAPVRDALGLLRAP